jgi:GxxExxY protein
MLLSHKIRRKYRLDGELDDSPVDLSFRGASAKMGLTAETQSSQRLRREEKAALAGGERETRFGDHMQTNMQINEITHSVIGAAIEVHRALGPGLLESVYQRCLARELEVRGMAYQTEYPIPLEYKGVYLECGYRLDLLVAGRVPVEVKSIDALAPIHESQLLTYLRLGGWNVGLLINFNVIVLKDGIRRKVMDYHE